jgi:hypothetical protein
MKTHHGSVAQIFNCSHFPSYMSTLGIFPLGYPDFFSFSAEVLKCSAAPTMAAPSSGHLYRNHLALTVVESPLSPQLWSPNIAMMKCRNLCVRNILHVCIDPLIPLHCFAIRTGRFSDSENHKQWLLRGSRASFVMLLKSTVCLISICLDLDFKGHNVGLHF